MTPPTEIPIFLHLASLWWGGCIYLLAREAFAARRFRRPITMLDPGERRARHQVISITVAVLAAFALIAFVSAFLPDEMHRGFWPA